MLWWPIECSGAGFGIGFEVASSGSAGLVVLWIYWFSSGGPVCRAGLFWCRIFELRKNRRFLAMCRDAWNIGYVAVSGCFSLSSWMVLSL